MKTILRVIFIFFLTNPSTIHAQDQFDGIHQSEYLGTDAVFFNPASIAGSPFKWNVNLISLNPGIGDITTSLGLKNIRSKGGNALDSTIFGVGAKPISAYAGLNLLGPGIMLSLGKNTAIAFSSRLRIMANIHDLDGGIVNAIQSGSNTNLPYSISNDQNQYIALNGYADFGLSIAQILLSQGPNLLKAGVSFRYIAGYSNNYIQLNNVNGTINSDANGVFLSPANGTVQIGEGGADLSSNANMHSLSFKGSGAGGDIGIIYEYLDPGKFAHAYRFKFSLALTDIGMISYTAVQQYTGGYIMNVPANGKFYLSDLKDSSISGIKNALNQSSYFTNLAIGETGYNVNLPTTLRAGLDLRLVDKFYLGAEARLALHDPSGFKDPYYLNAVTLTPRIDGKFFGAYLPLSVNQLTGFNAGFAFRTGPFFFGSADALTVLMGSGRQADFYMGLRFGAFQK